jgi:glycosyltransferase involved in cell wall biosynthesis
MKKRIAIFTPGGIGAGQFGQGYPPLLNFVLKISHEYEVTVYSIHAINADFFPENFKTRSVNRTIGFSALRTFFLCAIFLIDHIKKPFNLIHAFWAYPAGTLAVVMGKLVRVPSVVTVQGGEGAALKNIGYGNMIRPRVKKITLWTCEKATGFNSISFFLVDELKKHGLKRTDASVIPFGPERTIFKHVPKKKGKMLRLIHVANLTEVKDQFTLLRAFEIISQAIPAEIRIIGGDYMNGVIQRQAEEMGLTNKIKFLGAIPNKDLAEHYAWADVMMHTSLHEGQSGVVMEAMASGVVVCATRVGIVYDLGDQYFATAAVGDYNALAANAIRLFSDEDYCNALRRQSLAWVESFDASRTVVEFGNLYKKTIHG